MKRYDEIAKIVFKRRDEYISKQKKKKRIIISATVSALCCIFLLSFSLLYDFSGAGVPVADSQSKNTSSDNSSSLKPNSSEQTNSNNVGSQDEFSSNDTPSNITPPEEEDFYIDSIDKMNFYSAKKIISEKSLFPLNVKGDSARGFVLLNNQYVEYPIDRNKVFTTSMVTYFNITLNDENGFLAKKLGGTGLVEVVVTQNDIDDMGEMITFKRGEKYYTCFANGADYDPYSNAESHEFSSHKYIDGFSLVKNKNQENFRFTVHYDGSKVVGFKCAPYHGVPVENNVDDITFIEDFCVVLYTKQTFTIDELEIYFKNEREEASL